MVSSSCTVSCPGRRRVRAPLVIVTCPVSVKRLTISMVWNGPAPGRLEVRWWPPRTSSLPGAGPFRQARGEVVAAADVGRHNRQEVGEVLDVLVAAQLPLLGAFVIHTAAQGEGAEELLAPGVILSGDRAGQGQTEAGVHHPASTLELDIETHVRAGVLLGVDSAEAATHAQAETLERPGHELGVLAAVAAGALVLDVVGDGLRFDTGMAAQQHVEVAEGEGREMAAVDALEQVHARRAGLDADPLEVEGGVERVDAPVGHVRWLSRGHRGPPAASRSHSIACWGSSAVVPSACSCTARCMSSSERIGHTCSSTPSSRIWAVSSSVRPSRPMARRLAPVCSSSPRQI